MTILEKVKKLKKLGICEADLANIVGVSRQYIYSIRVKNPKKYFLVIHKAISLIKLKLIDL